MPTYVFYCDHCKRDIEVVIPMDDRDKRVVRCTKCFRKMARSYEGLRFNLRRNPPINQQMSESDIENLNANKRG